MRYNTIFHIDDDLVDCLIFKEAVDEISGVDYIWENNPVEALQKLITEEVCPQLIFLDLNMPQLNGYELLAEMEKHPNISAIPVIIFSTSLIGTSAHPIYANIVKQCTKPCDYTELKTILTQIILGVE